MKDPGIQKRSLGPLRKANKSIPKSPDITAQIKLQRHTIVRQFERTESDEIVANLAWVNYLHNEQCLTVELPSIVKSLQQPWKKAG